MSLVEREHPNVHELIRLGRDLKQLAKRNLPRDHEITLRISTFLEGVELLSEDLAEQIEDLRTQVDEGRQADAVHQSFSEVLADWTRGVADWVDIENVIRDCGPYVE